MLVELCSVITLSSIAYRSRFYLFRKRVIAEPVISTEDRAVVGYELLNRSFIKPSTDRQWTTWNRYLISQSLAMIERDYSTWVAINFDMEHILKFSDFTDTVRDTTSRHVIEWTERYVSDAYAEKYRTKKRFIEKAAEMLTDVRSRTGAQLSIDDAGSLDGKTDSITRINLVRPDFVKIDGELFQNSRDNAHARKSIEGLIRLSKDIGAITIMEWVETEGDFELAKGMGADLVQGYLFPHRHTIT